MNVGLNAYIDSFLTADRAWIQQKDKTDLLKNQFRYISFLSCFRGFILFLFRSFSFRGVNLWNARIKLITIIRIRCFFSEFLGTCARSLERYRKIVSDSVESTQAMQMALYGEMFNGFVELARKVNDACKTPVSLSFTFYFHTPVSRCH